MRPTIYLIAAVGFGSFLTPSSGQVEPGPGAVQTVPESGSIIAGSVGDQNITIFCELFDGFEGTQLLTSWRRQLLGESFSAAITADDPNFAFDGEPVPGLPGLTFDTNLTILTLTEDLDRAIIFCGAREIDDEAAHFIIRIYRAPYLRDISAPLSACEDRHASTIDLQAAGAEETFPFPQEFNWTRSGEAVDNSTDGGRVVYSYPNVTFNPFNRIDSGGYVLSAANFKTNGSLIGSDTGSFTLNVQYGPDFDAGDDRRAALEGGIVTLVCATNVDSNPQASVQWRDPMGSVVSRGGRYALNNGPEVVSLTIADVIADDNGNWSCTVSVAAATCGNPEQEQLIMLTVVGATDTTTAPTTESPTVPSTIVTSTIPQSPTAYPARLVGDGNGCPTEEEWAAARAAVLQDIYGQIVAQFGVVPSPLIGETAEVPATSCQQITDLAPASPSGYYWILSPGSEGLPVQVFCSLIER